MAIPPSHPEDHPTHPNPTIPDNLSNQCEQNLSNKGEGEQEDDMSAKSFGSKRSEQLVDASSMKSLIIEQSGHKRDYPNLSVHKRRNILVMEQTEVQSVHSGSNMVMKNSNSKNVNTNAKNVKTIKNLNEIYYDNNCGIEEEAESINDHPEE